MKIRITRNHTATLNSPPNTIPKISRVIISFRLTKVNLVSLELSIVNRILFFELPRVLLKAVSPEDIIIALFSKDYNTLLDL
jgi:hypothetical protein